jgi:hypothetical protein
MRGAHGVVGWGLALALAPLMAVGLLFGVIATTEAQERVQWESLGPEGQAVDRLFTPTSGALLARGKEALLRSDDGGVTWRTIAPPPETSVATVSPTDHQLLFSAGEGGVFRSADGGDNWERVSELGGRWTILEVSPADPNILYGVAITSPPAEYGTNRWHEFRVSHDSGATWETVRTEKERVVPGTQPCGYTVRLLQPHGVGTTSAITIEGCTGRGGDPLPERSADEGRTTQRFPEFPSESWAANAVAGGGGVSPDRWYVSLFRPGIPYSRNRHSKVVRSADDGVTWTTMYEAEGGSPDQGEAKPVDFVSTLAYDPRRPDNIFAVMSHYEPSPERGAQHRLAGFDVRRSQDGGMTWNELGAPDASSVSQLAVGIDGRYLFAATDKGVHRIALPQ